MQLEEAALHVPELSLLATELERGLKGNFRDAWGARRGTCAHTTPYARDSHAHYFMHWNRPIVRSTVSSQRS